MFLFFILKKKMQMYFFMEVYMVILYSCFEWYNHSSGKIVQLLWKIIWQFLKWLNKVTFWHSNSTPRNSPKGIQNIDQHKNLYTNIHRKIIHNSQKVERIQMLLSWQMNKQKLCIHTMEYYLVRKRNAVYPIRWMTLENIMIKSQSHTKTHLYNFIYMKCQE